MQINGLPLHALVVHGAVVLTPIAALAGLLHAVVPRWRDRLRWPLVVLATLAAVFVWVAYLSGEDLTEANQYGGPLHDLLQTHEERADGLRVAASVFAVATWIAAWWHTRGSVLRTLLAAVVGLAALATAVWVVLTGDAGAQLAWYGVQP